jgi:sporulation protein YlmC with PRC-barrel domain
MTSASTEVTDNNKASSIIGMEVRNNSDEKLGRIKDLVLDFQSGRISYAVLDGGSVFKSKLFAVPLSAFTTSSDSRYLILNADKSKIETAQGFDKTSWPSVNNPDWGASTFLQDTPANSSNKEWTPEHHMNNSKSDNMDKMNAPTASPSTPNQ